MFETSLRGIRPGKRRQRLPQSHTNEDGDGELISARVNTRVRRLHEEEDGLDGREASRVFGSESGEFERGLSLVRSLLLVLLLLLLRFCENALFWRIVFLLSTRLLLSFERRLIITLSSSFLCVRVCVCVCVINNIIVIHRVNEFFRRNLQLKGQHKTCAKRRAELSVAMSPVCEKREKDGIESKRSARGTRWRKF